MPSGIEVSAPMMGGVSDSQGLVKHEIDPTNNSNDNSEAPAEESVEVVLGKEGGTKIMEKPQVQDVFRHPSHMQRPRPMHAPPHSQSSLPMNPHPYYGSGSWGYYPESYRGAPYPVPPYNDSSGSFEDQNNYTPHIQYPRYQNSEDVNVISPNHKTDPQGPPMTPRSGSSSQYYQYPPTSPVSRPGSRTTPRLRSYPMRRGGGSEGAYPRAQEWGSPYPPPPTSSKVRPMPPVVADSFDSAQQQSRTGGPDSPKKSAPAMTDPHMQFYGGGGSWGGSFDMEDPRSGAAASYYGFPPDSPYSPYPPPPYSPGIYHSESFPSPHAAYSNPPLPPGYSYSYDGEDAERLLHDYNPDRDISPPSNRKKSRSKNATPISSNTTSNSMMLPKAAEEVDFDVTDPPMEPKTPESLVPVCDSIADVNTYDVLCGRGGGTNSQIGNRRFRQLVQEFQPIYLVAKRKEKPLLARTIVIVIRKRGGRFLKKNDDTGELWEVGDEKAEAKTSQALREGLDVRATKASAKSHDKKGKNNKKPRSPARKEVRAASPPTLPKLQGDEPIQQPSPTSTQFRKRRRVRSADKPFFSDFMPPRAEINRNDDGDDGVVEGEPSLQRAHSKDDADMQDCGAATGCAGIAFDIVSGAATGSFCLGPTGWRR